MARPFDDRSRNAPRPERAAEAPARDPVAAPARTLARRAAPLVGDAPMRSCEDDGPARDLSGIAGPGRPPVQRRDAGRPLDLARIKGPGRPSTVGGLPFALRADVEAHLGRSMGDVQVHRDSPKPARIGASAYAQGRDIHLGPGQERHLAHEAWHVVQQRQGRVKPTSRPNGVALNDDPSLEREADRMGGKADGGSPVLRTRPVAAGPAFPDVVQRVVDPGLDQWVREIESGDVYFAKWNQKHQRYDLDDPGGTFSLSIDPNDPAYEGIEDYDPSRSEDEDGRDGSDRETVDRAPDRPAAQADDMRADDLQADDMDLDGALDPDQHYKFTFTLPPEIAKAVTRRADDVGGRKTRKSKPGEPGHLPMLRAVNLAARTAAGNGAYKAGPKKGEISTFTYLDTQIAVRLDKIKKAKVSVNPRVSRVGSADKTTEELGTLVDGYEGSNLEAFLAGVRGESHQGKAGKGAYRDGVEARTTALISDVVDYPGNSVIAERLLARVRNRDAYIRLFTGGGSEHSYGALPSQNRATLVETTTDRKGPFAFVGSLLGDGTATTTSMKSNVGKLRKMQSLVDADPEIVAITAGPTRGKEAPSKVGSKPFSTYVSAQAMRARDEKTEIAGRHGLILVSEGESDSEDEQRRVAGLSAAQRLKRREQMDAMMKRLERKKRALESHEDKKPSRKKKKARRTPPETGSD